MPCWSPNPIEKPHFKKAWNGGKGFRLRVSCPNVPRISRRPLSICNAENDVTVVVFNVFLRKINFVFVVVGLARNGKTRALPPSSILRRHPTNPLQIPAHMESLTFAWFLSKNVGDGFVSFLVSHSYLFQIQRIQFAAVIHRILRLVLCIRPNIRPNT